MTREEKLCENCKEVEVNKEQEVCENCYQDLNYQAMVELCFLCQSGKTDCVCGERNDYQEYD